MTRMACLLALLSIPCAACEFALDVPEIVTISSWEATALAEGEASQVPLNVRISAEGCASLALGVSYVGELPAEVRSSPSGLMVGLDPADSMPLLELPADPGTVVDLQPVLAMRARSAGWPAGPASGSLRWRLYARDGLLESLLIERSSVVLAQVPAVLSVQIEGPQGRNRLDGAPTVLDLGRLERGAVHPLLIEVRGNSSARLSIVARHGVLQSMQRKAYTIPYSLRLDGTPFDGEVLLPAPSLNDGTTAARLELVLGEVERRAAGAYEEVLTLTVAAE